MFLEELLSEVAGVERDLRAEGFEDVSADAQLVSHRVDIGMGNMEERSEAESDIEALG